MGYNQYTRSNLVVLILFSFATCTTLTRYGSSYLEHASSDAYSLTIGCTREHGCYNRWVLMTCSFCSRQ